MNTDKLSKIMSNGEITSFGFIRKGDYKITLQELRNEVADTYLQVFKGCKALKHQQKENKMNIEEQDLENQIQEKGLTGKRITPDHVDSMIVSSDYHVFDKTQLTVCVLTLQNGFTVTGESACASLFDAEIGRTVAYNKAREKIWALEGYLLKQKLYEGE